MFDNIGAIMKLRGAWNTFTGNHPKFSAFLGEVGRNGAPEGTIIEIHMQYPDGKTYSSNMRVTASDLELMETIRAMAKK